MDFIAEYSTANGAGPSYRTICDRFGWSSLSSAVQHVEALQKKEYIARTPGVSGHIRILKRPEVVQVAEAA